MNRWTCGPAALAMLVVVTSACNEDRAGIKPDTAQTSGTTQASDTTQASGSDSAEHGGWIIKQGPNPDELWMVREDGTGAARWNPPLPEGYPWHPDWSPDGTQVIFEARTVDDPPTGLYVAPRDASSVRQIVDCAPPCEATEGPAWSPDGKRIAYWTSDAGSLQSIVVVDVSTGRRELTITPRGLQAPVAPRWSPDGTRLAVEVQHYKPAAEDDFVLTASWVAVVDLTVESPSFRRITPDGIWAKYPDWSPDGSAISFAAGNPDPFSHQGRPENLFTVSADGGAVDQLTHQEHGDQWIGTPTWEPDGFLVSLIGDDYEFRLATVTVDGEEIAEISDEYGAPVPGAHPRLTGGSAP